jgi:hypothetical protein
MSPSELTTYLEFAIKNRFNVLVTGKPGIGKSDIGHQASANAGREVILSHPVVSDPTDYKGLPFAANGVAEFLPFGDLRKLLEAEKPTTWFIDDLGQASSAVQASLMQILLAREINGHKISDNVSIIAATNRKEDKAAVSGLLEPVKSRFGGGIIELQVNHEDWVRWALQNSMPVELISFVRFRPDLLDKAVPTKEIKNSASPRTVAAVGKVQNAGVSESLMNEAFKGIVGESFATEYMAFLKLYKDLPSIDDIFLNPKTADIPKTPGGKYAISGAIAAKAKPDRMGAITQYIDRLPAENAVACMKDINIRSKECTRTQEFIQWASDKGDFLI